MCEIDSDEYAEVWVETPRKARKPHRCDCCNGVIKPGETYTHHFSKFDNSLSDQKKCPACTEAMKEFAAEPGHMLVMPDSFNEFLEECISESDDPKESRRWQRMQKAMATRGAAARRAG